MLLMQKCSVPGSMKSRSISLAGWSGPVVGVYCLMIISGSAT